MVLLHPTLHSLSRLQSATDLATCLDRSWLAGADKDSPHSDRPPKNQPNIRGCPPISHKDPGLALVPHRSSTNLMVVIRVALEL